MTERQPNFHPIEILPMIAEAIDGMVESDEEQLANLQKARHKPYILDDYTVGRIKEVFSKQGENLWIFDEQLKRWESLSLTDKQRSEVTRLQAQMSKLRKLNHDVLALGAELASGTIEKQMSKSDEEFGMELLMKMLSGEDPF